MLEKYVPLDTLLSYSRQVIYQIENIILETDILLEDFADFINTILDDDYHNYQTDISLLKLLYWYILDKVAIQSEDYKNEVEFSYFFRNKNNALINSLEELVEVDEENGVACYTCDENDLPKVMEIIGRISSERHARTIKWFINEFERCTNLVS